MNLGLFDAFLRKTKKSGKKTWQFAPANSTESSVSSCIWLAYIFRFNRILQSDTRAQWAVALLDAPIE